jgi:prevent-host-death family protein
MMRTISVGELRQNPTRMLREVREGAVYVVTDHGEPIAEVSPRREPRWTPLSELGALLRELGADEAWRAELEEDRAAVMASDPWEQRG